MSSDTPLSAGAAAERFGAPVLIGIDVGTTSLRAIAFDARGQKIAGGSRPTPLRSVETGGEYDPDQIFRVALEALAG